MRTWRATHDRKPKGTYWRLQAGAREERKAITLGYVTGAEADAACAAMNREEQTTWGLPQYDRVLRLNDANPEAARRYLIGDPVVTEIFASEAAVEPDYRHFNIRDYFAAIYEPYRAKAKPRSWVVERNMWKRIVADVGHMKVATFDEHSMDAFLSALTKVDGSPASWNTQRQSRTILTGLLKYAHRKKHRGPVPKWFNLEGSGTKTKRVALSEADLAKLLDASGPQLRAILGAAAGLALRPNEASRLRWEDIDWEAGALRVRGTKTDGSDALVPLLPIAQAELARWWEKCGRPTEGACFRRQRGGRGEFAPKAGSGVPWRKAFATAKKKAGFTKVRITPNSMRHTGATQLVANGVPVASVAKLLRHTSPRMVEQVYDLTGALLAPGLVAGAPRALTVKEGG